MKVSVLVSLLMVLGACFSQSPVSLKAYFDAHNKARTNPSYYAGFIQTEFKAPTDFSTNIHSRWRVRFNEQSPAQFDEAIAAVNTQSPMAPLTMNLGMTFSVWKHTQYLANTLKTLSHTGDGGTTPSQRAQPYTSGSSGMFENILFNSASGFTGEHIVAQYIIDDGVSSRGHRKNVFTASQTLIGVGISYDSTNRIYHGSVMANSYNCDKCSLITCADQKNCGWSQYLADSGLPDPCKSTNGSQASTPTPTPTPTLTPTPTPTPTPTLTPTITPSGVIIKPWPANLPTIKQYLDAINSARTNPKALAGYIQNSIQSNVDIGSNVHRQWMLRFNEPWSGLQADATNYLNMLSPVSPLVPELGLTYAAWSQANYCASVLKGQSFTGANGSTTRTRSQAYTSMMIPSLTENMLSTFVSSQTAQDYVATFTLDDGISSRARRLNTYNAGFAKIGVGLAKDESSNPNRFYVSSIMASAYNCDKCSLITCQMQADCGWRQYLQEAGLSDPCRA
jgi:uncharacterized protein YkwD